MTGRILRNLKRPMYWIPRILLIVFCFIHDKTKYQTAESISELFYWPDGFCLDMAVMALFFMVTLWCAWEDGKIFLVNNEQSRKEIEKESYT